QLRRYLLWRRRTGSRAVRRARGARGAGNAAPGRQRDGDAGNRRRALAGELRQGLARLRRPGGRVGACVTLLVGRSPAVVGRRCGSPRGAVRTTAPAPPGRLPILRGGTGAGSCRPAPAPARRIRGSCPASPERPCVVRSSPVCPAVRARSPAPDRPAG